MPLRDGDRPPCAACRHRHVRCTIDCPLAPYFPANEPEVFQNVLRLYGIANVTKILNQLNDNVEKQEAITSIKYESNIRNINPVHGCYGLTVSLLQNLNALTSELQRVRLSLESHRRNNINNQQLQIIQDNSQIMPSFTGLPVNNQIINDQSVDGLSNIPNDQYNQGFHFGGPSDRNAINEVLASRTMEPPFEDLGDQDDNEE
ncbi:hypothetical protein Lser_V15G20581 [Lactuca serriola]